MRKRKVVYNEDAEQEKKKLKADEKLKKKWAGNGYTSLSIHLESGEDDSDHAGYLSDEDENENEIVCLTGDATKPQPSKNLGGPFIIVKYVILIFIFLIGFSLLTVSSCSCLDDSGSWYVQIVFRLALSFS